MSLYGILNTDKLSQGQRWEYFRKFQIICEENAEKLFSKPGDPTC